MSPLPFAWILLLLVVPCLTSCSGHPLKSNRKEAHQARLADGSGLHRSSYLPECVRTTRGCLDVETEYIPGVVECELGRLTQSGPALEAQAIAARTFLARHLQGKKRSTVVPMSPRFQCWRPPQRLHSLKAAEYTSGIVLLWRGQLTSGNYVAGTRKLSIRCTPQSPAQSGYSYPTWTHMKDAFVAGGRTRKPFGGTDWTEIFVTQNEGKTAEGVKPTVIARPVVYNRGALSQNGAICLAENLGYETLDILQYYYGSDVTLSRPLMPQ